MYDNTDLVRQVMHVLAHGRSGLVTDIDGTISPIAARPDDARVLPLARDALRGLAERLPLVAVVTGRSVVDARQMVDLEGIAYIGNHGLEVLVNGMPETLSEAQPWVPRVRAVIDDVTRQVGEAEGVVVENKGPTASLHYRLSPDPEAMRAMLLEILARYGAGSGLRIEEGRRVINLLPPLTITKGSAVTWLVREHHLAAIVYLGDDITDTHAFGALATLRQSGEADTLAISVVGSETPLIVRELADTSVPSVTAVATLLSEVLDGLRSSDRMKSRAP